MIELPLSVDFTGKVVVVTGAGGVLCGDMARAFAQAGAKVAALDLNEDKVKKLAEELKNEENIIFCEKINKAISEHVEVVIGPIPFSSNGNTINMPFSDKEITIREMMHNINAKVLIA